MRVQMVSALALQQTDDLSRVHLASPYGSYDRLQPHRSPDKNKRKRMDGWFPQYRPAKC